jgi:hypothetical protein
VKVYDLKQNSWGEHKHFCRKICRTRFFNNIVVAASDTGKIHIMDGNAEEFSSDDNTTRMRQSLVIPKVQDLFTFTSKNLPHDTLNWKFPFKILIWLSLPVLDLLRSLLQHLNSTSINPQPHRWKQSLQLNCKTQRNNLCSTTTGGLFAFDR